jgi:tetratricopeptide (TPR) repeat protein
MEFKCDVCGIQATEGQLFAMESIPFRGGRSYCQNCHARLQRRFFQAGLVLDIVLGLGGVFLLLRDPGSRAGHCILNLFLIQLFLVLATLPHELAHAVAGRWCGLRVEKIILGFGAPIFAGKALGFNLEIKQIPYGGFTRALEFAGRERLLRLFVFHVAGPVASVVMAAVAWRLGGGTHGAALDLTVSASPWTLFSIANSTLAVHHLFPGTRSTSFGRMPSDGLALLQILFQRRVPSVLQEQETAPVKEVTTARKVAKRFSVLTFATGALVTFACAAFVARAAAGSGASKVLWLAAGLFAALAATFAWGAIWFQRRPWVPSPSHGLAALTRHHEVRTAFRAEINARSFWPPDSNYEKSFHRVQQADATGDFVEATAFLEEAIRWAPDNVALLGWRAMMLGSSGRHDEALAQFAALLAIGDLGLSIRATFLAEQIKAMLRAGRRQMACILCAEYLDEPGLLPEKLFLLDTVAAMPFQERLPHLLQDADQWSLQALALQPENLSLKTTRGAVLAEQGRFDEAVPLLREVHSRSEIEADKGVAAYFLALRAIQLGDRRTAARLMRQARLLQSDGWMRRRLDATPLP